MISIPRNLERFQWKKSGVLPIDPESLRQVNPSGNSIGFFGCGE